MESDEEGWFHGVLPKAGLWRIEIQSAVPSFATWTRADVDAGPSGKASLDIVLPDTRIFGHVVDEKGKPVGGADVVFQSESLWMFSNADNVGGFEVRGLPEGMIWLGAETSSQVSNRAFAVLAEGRAVGPIELRLIPTKPLTGNVLSSRGPVAGARVVVLGKGPNGGGAQAVTDTSGAFQVDLPKEVLGVEAIVSAPGFALQAFGELSANEPLLLQVNDEAGKLTLTLPSGEEVARKNLMLAAFQNGLYIPGNVLNQWAYDQGTGLQVTELFRVRRVAIGDYAVCFVPQSLPPALLAASIPKGADCVSGRLLPGSTLSLEPKLPE